MDQRTDAKRSIESSTRHLTEIAQELSRRASPRYIGDQAKETALNKTNEWKEQVSSSPLALGIIGGTIGALIGRAFAKERLMHTYARPALRYRTVSADSGGVHFNGMVDARGMQYGGESSNAGIGERISGTAHDLQNKAAGMLESVRDHVPSPSEVVSNVRDHLPSAAEVGHKVDENPMLVALGGLALGAVAALLLPVSRKEREMLAPVKQRAGEALGSLGDKIGEGAQQARETIAGQQPQAPRQTNESPDSLSPIATHH